MERLKVLLIIVLCTLCASTIRFSSSSLPASGTSALQQRNTDHYTAPGARLNIAPQKYFHESTSRGHYDARFGKASLSYLDRRGHLSALARAYLSTMDDIGAETWLMHGSLLGWYWNRKIMPWDTDIDVQITERSMQHLADHYNMTLYHFSLPGFSNGRDYLLEINPNWANPSTTDVNNKIDGRWLDVASGLYVDITTLRRDEQAEGKGAEGALMCKDGHRYKHKDIFPLRETTFEGMPAKVPFAYANVLGEEYGVCWYINHLTLCESVVPHFFSQQGLLVEQEHIQASSVRHRLAGMASLCRAGSKEKPHIETFGLGLGRVARIQGRGR